MTKGALYRHYENKRDIFLHIVKRMEQQDSEQARQNEVPEESIEKMPEEYQNVSVEDFVGYSKSMFEYWTEDDFASSFRKMLTLEQFRNEEMQKLYQQYLVSGPAEYVKDLFKNMEIKKQIDTDFQYQMRYNTSVTAQNIKMLRYERIQKCYDTERIGNR